MFACLLILPNSLCLCLGLSVTAPSLERMALKRNCPLESSGTMCPGTRARCSRGISGVGCMHLLTVVGPGLLQVHRRGGFPGKLAARLSHSSCQNPSKHHLPARHGSAVTAAVALEGRAGPQSESHLGVIFVLAGVARQMRQVGATLEGPAVVGKLGRVGPQGICGMGCFVLTKVRENERNGISPHQRAMWKESKRKW